MVGAFAVGKTSLVSRFVHQMFTEKYLTTIGVKIDKKSIDLDGQHIDLMLWDLAGEDDFQSVRMSYLRGAHGYFLVIDGTRKETLETAIELQQRVEKEIGEAPFLALINKSDIADQWQLTSSDLERLVGLGWNILKTSAKDDLGVEDAFKTLTGKIMAGPKTTS